MTIVNSSDIGPSAALLEELEIFNLVRAERFARDRGDWDSLSQAYLPVSYVRTTWFQGTGAEFAARSEEMAHEGRHSKHPIWPIYAKVNDDRAIVESYSQIQNRSIIDGVEVDMVQYCRFFSQLVRTVSGWKFLSFEAIYQKDAITAVNPADEVPIDWNEIEGLRPAYRIWAWAMQRRGYEVPQDLLGDDRPDLVQAHYARMDIWLAGG